MNSQNPSSNQNLRYCGRTFTTKEIEWIRRLIASEPRRNRKQLSLLVCEELGWVRPDGRLKDMSCRVAMLRMHRDGIISLPPPQNPNGNGRARPRITSASNPRKPISMPAEMLGELLLKPINKTKDSYLWNELIQRYHYLGYKPLPGAQIRYLVKSHLGLLAVIGFSASSWKIKPRDQFIGWTPKQRQQNLHLIVNNSRFLILPWVKSYNLASRILAAAVKQLSSDWHNRYGYKPALLETFVQKDRFHGTCYKAANWIHVGQTQGRGKLDRYNKRPLPIKDIFLYPINKRFREILCS